LDESLILLWCVAVYPASVYIILFGLSLAPFVDLLPGSQGRVKIYKDKAGTVRYDTVRYGTVRYGTVRYGTVRYGTENCHQEQRNGDVVITHLFSESAGREGVGVWGVDTRVVDPHHFNADPAPDPSFLFYADRI
jgi:hypothetical protein